MVIRYQIFNWNLFYMRYIDRDTANENLKCFQK